MWLLQKNYPTFFGTGRHRRPDSRNSQRCGTTSDSGISGSESDSDTDCEDAGDAKPTPESSRTDTINSVRSSEDLGEFSTPLPPDEVEVNYDGEVITIELGSGIKGDESTMEACVDALCNQLGSVCAHQVLEEGLAALVNDSPQGKTDECDDDPDDADTGPDIDEN